LSLPDPFARPIRHKMVRFRFPGNYTIVPSKIRVQLCPSVVKTFLNGTIPAKKH